MRELTTQQVADYFNTTVGAVVKLAQRNRLKPSRRVGRALLFSEDDVRAFRPQPRGRPVRSATLY